MRTTRTREGFPLVIFLFLSFGMTRPPRARNPVRLFTARRMRAYFCPRRDAPPRIRATLQPRVEPLRPQWSSGRHPRIASRRAALRRVAPRRPPFRMKGEKSRGASRRYCVTCRCGSVCGRQRRHDDANAVVSLSLNYSLTRAHRGMDGARARASERE